MVTTDQVNSLTRTPAQEIFNAIMSGYNGLLVNEGDIDGLAEAII